MASEERKYLLDSLRSGDVDRGGRALERLAEPGQELDSELLDAVLPFLGVVNKQLSRRAATTLARAVADVGSQAHARVRALLEQGSVIERWGAAFTLAEAEFLDGGVGEASLAALALGDGDIRWAAAGIVCAVAQREPAFMQRLQEVSAAASGEQLKMSIYCLRDLGCCEPRLYLNALGAPDIGSRHAALSALKACGEADDATVEAVLGRLTAETDAGVRRSLAIVLGHIMGTHAAAADALRRAAASSEDANFVRAVESVLRGR